MLGWQVFAWLRNIEPHINSFTFIAYDAGKAIYQVTNGIGVSNSIQRILDKVLVPLVSHGFIHAGPIHALSTALCILALGSKLEAKGTSIRYLLFFFAITMAAAVTYYFQLPYDKTRVGGFSPFAFGIVGAYLCLYFRRKIVVLLLPIPVIVTIPAIVFAVMFSCLQFRQVQCFLLLVV